MQGADIKFCQQVLSILIALLIDWFIKTINYDQYNNKFH